MALTFACHIPLGGRPTEPEDTSAIGSSDTVGFHGALLGGEIEPWPKVGEVVTHLGKAAVEWGEFEIRFSLVIIP